MKTKVLNLLVSTAANAEKDINCDVVNFARKIIKMSGDETDTYAEKKLVENLKYLSFSDLQILI